MFRTHFSAAGENFGKFTGQLLGEAASESQIIPPKRETIKQDNKPRDLSNEVIKALPLMNDNANWQKRK